MLLLQLQLAQFLGVRSEGAIATQGRQQDTNDVTLLIAKINQLEDKVKSQEDIIRLAKERINELERQLTKQTERNNKLRSLCDKAGIKLTTEPNKISDPNRLKPQHIKPNLSTGENKDALRVKRVSKEIQKMEDAIELDEKQMECLPPHYCIDPHRGRHWPCTCPLRRAIEHLETAKEKWQLLADQEKNYKQILQFAEKHSDLGIDVMDVKKELIECQGRMGEVEWEKERLREITHTH